MWCQKRDSQCRRWEAKGYSAHGGKRLEPNVEICIRFREDAQRVKNDDETECLLIVGAICEVAFQRINEEAKPGAYEMK